MIPEVVYQGRCCQQQFILSHTVHVTSREVEEAASTITFVGAPGAGGGIERDIVMESVDTQTNHSLLGRVHS